MRPELASSVTELDPNDNHAGRCEIVTPTAVTGVGGFQDCHASAVGMDDARHWPVGSVGPMDVQVDVVAIDPGDHFGPRTDPAGLRGVGDNKVSECVKAGLGLQAVCKQLLDRVGSGDR